MARASGLDMDMRRLGYAAYKYLEVEPVVETEGDCHSRCRVRIGEIFHSIDLIRQAAGKIHEGPIEVKVTGAPAGEYYSRVEQPRGEVIHYVKGNGTEIPRTPGAGPHVQQYPVDDQGAQGSGSGRCAGYRSNPRPVHQLHGEVERGTKMKFFTMTKTVTKNLAKGPATLMYPQREQDFYPHRPGEDRKHHRRLHFLRPLQQGIPPRPCHYRQQRGEDVADRPSQVLHLQPLRGGLPETIPLNAQSLYAPRNRATDGDPSGKPFGSASLG